MSYSRGTGYAGLNCCGTDTKCELCQGRWYRKCAPGFTPVNCTRCVRTTNVVVSKTSIWSYILVIITIIFILSFFYRLFMTPVVSENTIPDLLLGTPGVSDPYSSLERLGQGSEPLYYV